MLIADVPCRHCGYNLRGLRQDSRCPECGVPVSLAIHGDLLSYADPGWVAGLARGTTYILWGVLITLLVAVLNVGLEHLAAIPAAVTAGVALFAGLVGFYGAWLLTARDPSGIGEDPYVTARKIVRTGLLVGLVGETALVAIVAVGGVGVCGLGMIMLVIGVASLVLLFGLRKALQAQAELARHHWAPESVAATPAQ